MQTHGNRDPYTPDEQLPMFETVKLKHAGKPWQVRYNFSEHTIPEQDQPARRTFNYHYADVNELTSQCLFEAGVPDETILLITE